jgi:hypothetical protein
MKLFDTIGSLFSDQIHRELGWLLPEGEYTEYLWRTRRQDPPQAETTDLETLEERNDAVL